MVSVVYIESKVAKGEKREGGLNENAQRIRISFGMKKLYYFTQRMPVGKIISALITWILTDPFPAALPINLTIPDFSIHVFIQEIQSRKVASPMSI